MRRIAVVLTACLLSGCSSLPEVGPSASDVVAPENSAARYDVVDISPYTIEVMRGHFDNSLSSFGDYRASVEPRIGVGDSIAINIWEASAGGLFSAPPVTIDRSSAGSKSAMIPEQVVGRDGAITVPYAGRLRVVGRSPQDVQKVIERSLEGKAIQPQVLVSVTRSISNAVTVVGEVTNGARLPLSVRGDRLLDIIATAGGVRAPVNETFVQLMRGNRTARVALSRVTSDPTQNIYLRPNDVLTLIRDPQTFIAVGATGANAEIHFDAEGITLAQALAKAGGLQDWRADPMGVFVFRYEPEAIARQLVPDSPIAAKAAMRPVVYRLNLRDPNGMFLEQRFKVRNRDLIYVSNAPFTEVQKVMQVFNLAMSPAAASASVYTSLK